LHAIGRALPAGSRLVLPTPALQVHGTFPLAPRPAGVIGVHLGSAIQCNRATLTGLNNVEHAVLSYQGDTRIAHKDVSNHGMLDWRPDGRKRKAPADKPARRAERPPAKRQR
jgi:hypothetical protein